MEDAKKNKTPHELQICGCLHETCASQAMNLLAYTLFLCKLNEIYEGLTKI
ncbi:hypothetical protein EWB00_000123 [Schistosoma japonicum]|uniref:Uncharacterized protein n=1 Tax=Schistosoma japonicum TaxID=6182 RepID=A0A4Z2CL37_SCHJA|nr:hypothetical protein EWB00_000123 [Schistosoma japonicum]